MSWASFIDFFKALTRPSAEELAALEHRRKGLEAARKVTADREEARRLYAQSCEQAFDRAVIKVDERITKHGDALARKKSQVVYLDDYGQEVKSRWIKEVDLFIHNVLVEACGLQLIRDKRDIPGDLMFHFPNTGSCRTISRDSIVRKIDAVIAARNETLDSRGFPNDSADPFQFETNCLAQLIKYGWIARLTSPGADQGVDIIAERDGLVLALQCKRYTSAVGNGAVQEVNAGREHYKATHAAVVTNSTFTKSAKLLAGTNKVLLIHHSQLPELHNLLESTQPKAKARGRNKCERPKGHSP